MSVCVRRGWGNTTLEPDTVFGPAWQALPTKARSLGHLEKAPFNEDGYMVWHTMIVPRKNVTPANQQRQKKRKKH